MKGCNKVLYENYEGEVHCGSYMSGGIMLCMECQNKANAVTKLINKGGEK